MSEVKTICLCGLESSVPECTFMGTAIDSNTDPVKVCSAFNNDCEYQELYDIKWICKKRQYETED